MIYSFILLDVLINNYTKYTSYFFILYLYNKPYKYYLLTALILDLIIFKSFYNIIILTIIYIINYIFKDLNKKNIYNYLFINIFNYIIYIILSNIFIWNSLQIILIKIGKNIFFNLIIFLLSYSLIRKDSYAKYRKWY